MGKAKSEERRRKLDELREQQRREDRRRNWLFGGIGAALALLILGGTIIAIINQQANSPEKKAVASFGVAASDAGCGKVQTAASSGTNNHVGPGTNTPNQTRVSYSTVPPTFGPHFPTPASGSKVFYTEKDRPPVENLVHNLEHGYVVVWYDPSLDDDSVADLKSIATNLHAQSATTKIIVSAWDNSYGNFPNGSKVALAHWGTKEGARQLCGKVSGEAMASFMKKYPPTDSPEPLGA